MQSIPNWQPGVEQLAPCQPMKQLQSMLPSIQPFTQVEAVVSTVPQSAPMKPVWHKQAPAGPAAYEHHPPFMQSPTWQPAVAQSAPIQPLKQTQLSSLFTQPLPLHGPVTFTAVPQSASLQPARHIQTPAELSWYEHHPPFKQSPVWQPAVSQSSPVQPLKQLQTMFSSSQPWPWTQA